MFKCRHNLSVKTGLSLLYSAAIFGLLMFHMLYPVNFYLGNTIYKYLYWPFVIVIIILCMFCKNGFAGCVEVKLLWAYCAWLLISRFLNGDAWLKKDLFFVLESVVLCCCVPVMFNLGENGRDRFMLLFNFAVSSFTTVFACIGIYAAIFQRWLVNPITGATLAAYVGEGARLSVLDYNCNVCALWFFIGFWMSVYTAVKHKNVLVRIFAGVACIANYLAMALTFSRNVKVAFALCIGVLFLICAFRYVKIKKPSIKIIILSLFAIIAITFSCKAFDFAAYSIGEISKTAMNQEEIVQEQAEDNSEESTQAQYVDTRGFKDTGRIPIYKSIFKEIAKTPGVLARGSLAGSLMESASKRLNTYFGHAHNTYLEVLFTAGIPGFLLIAAFCILLLIRILKLFMSGVRLEEKILAFPVLGYLWYNMLESSWLAVLDFRAIAFMILAGALLAYSYDVEARGAKR